MNQSSQSDKIHAEANRILESGLRDLLSEYGEIHVVGSYALRLMTWNDLDIHVISEDTDLEKFFGLGGHIATLLQPHRMHFRNEIEVGISGLPRGLYWGIYLGDERDGAWKIDVWQTNRRAFESVRRFGEEIASRLNDENRETILAIKAACWRHPEYRRGFTSADIYAAVLEREVRNIGEFWTDLRKTKGIVIL